MRSIFFRILFALAIFISFIFIIASAAFAQTFTMDAKGSDANITVTWSFPLFSADSIRGELWAAGPYSYDVQIDVFNGDRARDGNKVLEVGQPNYPLTLTYKIYQYSKIGAGWSTTYILMYSKELTASATTAAFIPPSNLKATYDVHLDKIVLNWENHSDYGTHFYIYRDDSSMMMDHPTTYTDTTAINGKEYTYKVCSAHRISAGNWVKSDKVEVKGRARPMTVTASNGNYKNRTKISWKDVSDLNEKYLIYRDGEQIDYTTGGGRAYYDYNGVPGKIHRYGVTSYRSAWGENSQHVTAFGWMQPNGKLEGSVKTKYGAGVDSVEIDMQSLGLGCNTFLKFDGSVSCLKFDGSVSSYVIMNPYIEFPSDAFTISFWIKTEDNGNSFLFSYATLEHNNTFYISMNPNLIISMRDDTLAYGTTGDTEISINDGDWHHIAVTWQSSDGEFCIIKDGIISFTGSLLQGSSIPDSGSLVFGQDQDMLGGGFQESQAFGGYLDEVRIWNKARSADDIQADMNKKLIGDETGLVSYWTFDDLSDRTPAGITGDYAQGGYGQHGLIYGAQYVDENNPVPGKIFTDVYGNYSLDNIYYGQSANIKLRPLKEGHKFDPDSVNIKMSVKSPVHESVNFVDTTSLTISGVVKFAGTDCMLKDVEIFKNDVSTNVFTDANGAFSLSIEQPDVYTIKPVYGDSIYAHKFDPASITLDLQKDALNLEFADTTFRRLRGRFSGSCGAFIGKADIKISPMNNSAGCQDTTIATDDNGNYEIFLPAQPYKIKIIAVYDSGEGSMFEEIVEEYFISDTTVDLSWTEVEYYFVYREAPKILVSGWPEFGGGEYNVPIMEQGEIYDLEIEVWEYGGEDSCLVDQGTITITDNISGESGLVTLELTNGMATYPCRPLEPNFSPPHQKTIEISAHVGVEFAFYSQSAVITGHHVNDPEFITIASPKMPLWVLNDPPGDQSYSYFMKDSSYSRTIRNTSNVVSGYGVFANLHPGVIASHGINCGFGIGAKVSKTWSTDFGVYAIAEGRRIKGTEEEHTYTNTVTFTASQEFRTSDSDKFLGSEGDLYIGVALNDVFALTDMLTFDMTNNEVKLDKALAHVMSKFKTDFIYTESHITNVLIPQLRELARIDTNNAPAYNEQISIWETKIENNHNLQLPDSSRSSDDEDLYTYKNYSVSAGALLTETYTTHPTDKAWLSYNKNTFNYEEKLGGGVVAFGCTYEVGSDHQYSKVEGDEYEGSVKVSETYGYTLADDDPGDFFSVDVKYRYRKPLSLPGFPVDTLSLIYGPPIFNLVAGVSSNPWEKGTQARDCPEIEITKYPDTPLEFEPNELAPFILTLRNSSESGEEREYHLSVIQSSNLDGAIIRVGGVVIEDYLSYTIPAKEQLTATLSVERGPMVYDYENLKVKFYAPGDEETIADTATFSVHYINPGSDVNLYQPVNNWVVNASNNNSLLVVINDYDALNENLKSICFQYRRIGESWSGSEASYCIYQDSLKNLIKDTDPYGLNDYIEYDWDISELPDGKYELRAKCVNKSGSNYSAISSGVIDRSALVVLGTPQPADGILNIGEDISISFNAAIDKAFLSEINIVLKTADDSAAIGFEMAAYENTLTITVAPDTLAACENRRLIVAVSGVRDTHGNRLKKEVTWLFTVNQNALHWLISNANKNIYKGSQDNFITSLTNVGGVDNSFILIGLPDWLTANPMNGSLPPGGMLEINFTLSDQLEQGVYLDTVVAQVTGQGDDPLFISINVLSQPPLWNLNPANYQYSMDVIARLKEGNGFAKDEMDIVAAFVGNEIRGKVNLTNVSEENGCLAFLTIYSNQQSGETINFRSWDASKGEESGFIEETISFQDNHSVGMLLSPFVLTPSGKTQSIPLTPNWNWFSLNLEYQDMSVDKVLNNLNASSGDVIKGQKGIATFWDETMSGSSNNNGWIGDLDSLEVGQSYRIFLAEEQNLHFAGDIINLAEKPIMVYKGWNWIGYLPQQNLDINNVFAGFNHGDGDRLKSQNAFSVYEAATNSWQGALTFLNPGEGYLLKSSNEGFLSFSETSSGFSLSKTNNSSLKKINLTDYELSPYNFEYNMSIIGAVQLGGTTVMDSNFYVIASVNDSLRGKANVQYFAGINKALVFMSVYSNNTTGEELIFEVINPSEGIKLPIAETLPFSSDEIIGGVDNPYAFAGIDEVAPQIRSAFLYSTEPSLADHLCLYITSDELLKEAPLVRVISPTGKIEVLSSEVFDAGENIYLAKYHAKEFGENTFYITACDLSENLTNDVRKINVNQINLGKSAAIVLTDWVSVTLLPNSFQSNGVFYSEYFKTTKDSVKTNLTRITENIVSSASSDINEGFRLSFDLKDVKMNEDEKRKIGLYRLDEEKKDWIFTGGQGEKNRLDQLVDRTGTYALFYDDDRIPIPKQFQLHQNYPNPFNPVTTISFDLPDKQFVSLTIFNIHGQKVKQLVHQELEAGYHKTKWDGLNEFGVKVASGIFIYRIIAGKNIVNKKMIFIK